jgi:hypothetical protein
MAKIMLVTGRWSATPMPPEFFTAWYSGNPTRSSRS